MSQLYHRDIGFPAVVETLFGKKLTFRFTRHSLRSCLNDRYGFFTPPMEWTIQPGQIIEADTDGAAIYKIVLRVPHTEAFDVCLAVMPNPGGQSLVKTCWRNRTSDSHATLDRSKYAVHLPT